MTEKEVEQSLIKEDGNGSTGENFRFILLRSISTSAEVTLLKSEVFEPEKNLSYRKGLLDKPLVDRKILFPRCSLVILSMKNWCSLVQKVF